MFAVEIRIFNEDALGDAMTGMREWLDHRRFEPSTFRFTFSSPGILFRVEFPLQAEAVKFAEAYRGEVIAIAGTAAQTAP